MIDPTLNAFPTESTCHAPRGLVKINGSLVDFISIEVDNNTNYQADMFRVEIPVNTLPKDVSINNMIAAGNLEVEILGGYPSNPTVVSTAGLDTWILGNVDDLNYDPCSEVVILSGRDKTALFQDTKLADMYKNKKSSDIAQILADNEGLVGIITPTTTLVGDYYQIDHVNINKLISEWDLLTYLANREQFDVFVSANNLYFQPQSQTKTPYLINLSQNNTNVISIHLSHNKVLARDVIVKVKSWNQLQQKGFIATARSRHTRGSSIAGASPSAGVPQEYSYTFANLTEQQAKQKASSIAAQITQHELRINATLIGTNLLTKQSVINVRGSGTNFDQDYFPSSIMRRLNISEGYIIDIIAKNHATDSQVTI